MDEILNHIGLRTRATRVSSSLAKLTHSPKGQAEDALGTRGSSSSDGDEFPVIDASDLILSDQHPLATQSGIPQSNSEPDWTCHSQSEPVPVSSCLNGRNQSDSCVAAHHPESASTDQSCLEKKLPNETVGQEVNRLRECSINSEGVSSEDGSHDVEVGEDPLS